MMLMKTVSVNIQNLCAPCNASCRHCLLNACHKATGVDYSRGEAFARSFYKWLKENRPELQGMYYAGYCMDFPEADKFAAYFREQTGMTHFMFDGIAIRDEQQTQSFLISLQNAGIRRLHYTFYGLQAYHDRFAGRKGDFDYIMQTAKIARTMCMSVSAGIMVTMENLDQLEALVLLLKNAGITDITPLLPHGKGRGYALSDIRLTEAGYRQLPTCIREKLPRDKYRTEVQWLAQGSFPQQSVRHLTLSLTPENMARLEKMHPADMISELEEMDEAFYSKLPDMDTLALRYGKPENTQLFRFRDLYLQWQKRYMAEHPILPDMTDERYSFSTRIFA